MTKHLAGTGSDITEGCAETSSKNRRDIVIKVRVNAAEKMELDRQKGRLSCSAFLRDRGLNQGQVYDPTYSAIGSVYQSARNLGKSAVSIEDARIHLRNSAVMLTGLIGQEGGEERAENIGRDLAAIAERLHSHVAELDRQAFTLAQQARSLADQHMKEMLKRYPAKALEPRKRR